MNRNLIHIMVLLVAIALMTAFLQYGRHHQAINEWQQCKDNEKNLATALEMYSTDFAGRYPTDPRALVPNYLTRLPECPVQGQAYIIETTSVPDVLTITCTGQQHLEAGHEKADTGYYSAQGSLERPDTEENRTAWFQFWPFR